MGAQKNRTRQFDKQDRRRKINIWNLQLHLSIGRPAMIYSSAKYLNNCDVMYNTETNCKLCGNFVWLDMGLTIPLKESNTLNASVFIQVGSLLHRRLFIFICTQLRTVFM